MKKLRNLIIIMILTFIGIINVNAEENYKINVFAETGYFGADLRMTLEGFDKKAAIENGDLYYAKFVNEDDEKPALEDIDFLGEPGLSNFNYITVAYDSENDGYFSFIEVTHDWYMIEGYTKVYIIKKNRYNDEYKIIDEPIILEKPELPELSERYEVYLDWNSESTKYKNTLSVHPQYPNVDDIGSHELNVKFGIIKDENLLKKLANKERDSLEELMKYAKTTEGKTYTHKDYEFSFTDAIDFEVVNGAYYYAYTYYTNTDGVYRNLEDVTVVMGKYDRLVNDVDWSRYNLKDKLLEKFVEKYKKTGVLDLFDETYNFEIQPSDTSLRIVYSNNEGISGETNFDYVGGILTYIPSKDESTKFIESLLVANTVQAVVDLYGYDVEKIDSWINQDRKFTLADDGIEFEKVSKKEVDGNSTLEYDVFNSFRMDIRGFKSFETENKPEELKKNPSTATNLGYGILITILVTGILGYIYIKKQSKFPKHN